MRARERASAESRNPSVARRLQTRSPVRGLTAMASTPGTVYASTDLSRSDVDALPGPVVLDFGTGWCGVCRRTAPLVVAALAAHPHVRHLRIEDGAGRRLGRSFRIKLWPTLVFLRDGREIERLVRPNDAEAIGLALSRIDPR